MNIGLQWSAWKPASYLVKHLQFERQCSFPTCISFGLFSVCISVCLHLIGCLFLPFLSLCSHSFLPHLFLCVCHYFCLPFSPRPCIFFPPKTSAPFFLSFLSHSALWKFIQRRAQLDSVSLVIQGSMEGELSLMDNLSGSICHYYALPPKPRKHSSDKKVNTHQNDDSLPPFHTCSGSYFSPVCRAAPVTSRK